MDTKALYKITYGLYVVGSSTGGKLNGQIANTVIQVCSEPVRLAVAINKNNYTHSCIVDSKVFSVSFLSQDTPLSFIGGFGFRSGRDVDKFKDIKYQLAGDNVPVVLDHALAYLVAKVVNQVDVGTHTLFIGELIDADVIKDGEPMTYAYYHQVKRGTTPKSAPSYIEVKKEVAPKMSKYECSICGYVYDPELGDPEGAIESGTPFEQVPDDWVCPVCGASKDQFDKVED
jgi:flavin reductase (DIM6/NTAB) family NADH-FMN oxidoreductase RutF/rubredoxin